VKEYFRKARGGHWITNVCFIEALTALKCKWLRKEIDQNAYLGFSYVLRSYIKSRIELVDSQLGDRQVWDETEKIVKRYSLDIVDALQIVTVKRHYTNVFARNSKTVLVTGDFNLARAAESEDVRVWNCMTDEAPY